MPLHARVLHTHACVCIHRHVLSVTRARIPACAQGYVIFVCVCVYIHVCLHGSVCMCAHVCVHTPISV